MSSNNSISSILRKIFVFLKAQINKIEHFNQMKTSEFKVVFKNDGDAEIIMPRLNIFEALFFSSDQFDKQSELFFRPSKEALLRKVIFNLFETGYLNKQKSIIDIGCWLSDNTLPWARILTDGGVVHAVDPSKENLKFGENIAQLNNISNINWVEGVCSDIAGIPLSFKGDIGHAEFSESQDTSDTIISTTLDEIIDKSNNKDISLIHIDVEGFELKVLRGADAIIERCRPTIVFEHFIAKEEISPIADFLGAKDYKLFMINEVPYNFSLDCRNFIALDNLRQLPNMLNIDHHLGREQGIFYASLGGPLISIDEREINSESVG